MELTLNFAWMVLATLMFWLWLHHAARDGVCRRTQLIALAVVILIIFPVISVTDDLLAVQNPAETDCCQRKDHAGPNAHFMPHAVADLTLSAPAELPFGHVRHVPLGNFSAPHVAVPAMDSIQNRPPPAA
jgi:hypothetical protein